MQASLGTVLAAAIVATAGGVGWLIVKLPARLDRMESRIDVEIQYRQQINQAVQGLEEKDRQQDRQIIRLEAGQ